MKPEFTAGQNIAMKVPEHEYDSVITFYRDILGLMEVNMTHKDNPDSRTFNFGDKLLWIDRVKQLSQAEIWLEIKTDDVQQAKDYLAQKKCTFCENIEILPEGFQGFWVSSPANIIHLISQD